MATSIISCAGENQAWQRNSTDDGFVCPECLLTPDELGIKTRTRNGKLTPATIPSHDVEVDGTEVKYVLVNGDFKVHTPSCPQLKRDLKESDYDKPYTVVATDRHDAVTQLWDDQIGEAYVDDEGNSLGDDPTDEFLRDHGYYAATEFHSRCLAKILPDPSKPEKGTANVKREAKRDLADKVVAAIAAALAEESDDNKRIATQWIHHLPVHRENWPTGFPTPERSDWAETPAEQPEETDAEDTTDDSETTEE